MPNTLLATQVPVPNYYSGLLKLYDIEQGTSDPPISRKVTSGDTVTVPTNITRNAGGQDLLARYGAGAYGIAYGLGLSAGSGLNVVIAVGQAVADGVIDVPVALTLTVADNSPRIHVWLKQDGTATYANNLLTVPTGGIVYLGSCVTSGGSITGGSFDTSGVMYIVNGTPERTTADPGKPGDTPSANTRFWTTTLGGRWLWDGTRYYRQMDGMSVNQTTINTGESLAVPPSTQVWLYGDIVCDGTLLVDGSMRIDN